MIDHMWELWSLFDKTLFFFFNQGTNLTKTSIGIISLVGDAVMALRVPDEGMISMETTGLTVTLGRHSPHNLLGLTITEKDARFALPAEKNLLESSSIPGASFVDTQVWMLYQVLDGDRPEGRRLAFLILKS